MSKSNKINPRNMTQADLCRFLQIMPSTMNNWLSHGCPTDDSGAKKSYDIAQVHKWKLNHELEKQKERVKAQTELDGDLTGDSESSGQLERYRKYKADQVKFDLEIKKGKYIEKEDVEQWIRNCGEFTKHSFENLGKDLSVKVSREKDPKECQKIIEQVVDEILKEMGTREH